MATKLPPFHNMATKLPLCHELSIDNDLFYPARIIGMVAPAWYQYDHIYPVQRSLVWTFEIPPPDEMADNGTLDLTDERGKGPLVSVETYE